MSDIDRAEIISDWIAAANTHDADAYLAFFTDDATLDDPSVGGRFEGKDGIKQYFDSYFIGYNTTTRLVSVTPEEDHVQTPIRHVSIELPAADELDVRRRLRA